MTSVTRTVRWLVVLSLLVTGVAAMSSAALAAGEVDRVQQEELCDWEQLPGQAARGTFHFASAMDTANQQYYFYGGLDQVNDVVNYIARIDLSATDIDNAAHKTVSPTGSRQDRYAAVGAYRPAGDDSAIYFIAGGQQDGSGENDVQVYNIKDDTWSFIAPSGPFGERLFASGAYDPDHDIIVVHGGTRQCRADGSDVDDADACVGANFGTSYLVFDPSGGEPVWQNGAAGGPGQIYGATMVYDSTAKRMLVFGGTTDGEKGKNETWELDLSDPDLTNAKWSKLATTGQVSARFLHAAAYDRGKDQMVVYGGVTKDAFTTKENADSDTYALDLTQTPAEWLRLDPATAGDRVGLGMAYDEAHSTPILHAGRRRFTSGTQNVHRDSYYLKCEPKAPEPPTATPVPPGPGTDPIACPFVTNRVPAVVIAAALASPDDVQGYLELQNPSIPESPWNIRKRYLSIRNPGVPWNQLFNGLVFKAGCP